MHPSGANKKRVAHAIFSNAGPNLISPAETIIPRVIPKICKFINKANIITPISYIDTPKRGIANIETGTKPINVLIIAVKVNAVINSLFLIGVIKRLVKFLLHISSKNMML